jgi:hypothetical protein
LFPPKANKRRKSQDWRYHKEKNNEHSATNFLSMSALKMNVVSGAQKTFTNEFGFAK